MSLVKLKAPFVFCLATCFIAIETPLPLHSKSIAYSVDDKDEAFLVRRIAEFWKDKDYAIVKAQILDFLEKYPKSKINDHLCGVLGDLYLQEGSYQEALSAYDRIQSLPILEKIIVNKLQSLYELNFFEAMTQEGSRFLGKLPNDVEARKNEFYFLMAEGFFRSGIALSDNAKKREYFAKAEPLYEALLGSSFESSAMFALAEIYHVQESYEKAALFFQQLAEIHADKREDLLFHAALAEVEFDRKAAILSFAKVVEKGGARAKEAAFNQFVLLFQEDRFDEVLSLYPNIMQGGHKDKEPLLTYMIGRSYFAKNTYTEAKTWLGKYLKDADASSLEFRNALLMQLNTAEALKDVSLYNETFTQLETFFPHDVELPQALFIQAMMLKEAGRTKEASELLEKVVREHPHFENREALLLECGLVAHANGKWKESYKTLSLFLQNYPHHAHAALAQKYLLSSGLTLIQQTDHNEESSYTKEDFYNDLKKATSTETLLLPNELQETLLLQAKIAYELSKYHEALFVLEPYLSNYKEDKTIFEAHLLTALCYQKLQASPHLFLSHAEKALAGNLDHANLGAVHLELYNTYLSLAETEENKEELYELAANHLYEALERDDKIKLENRLWLANYYYDKAIKLPELFETDGKAPGIEMQFAYNRARALLQNLLIKPASFELVSLDEKSSSLEWEVLKFANLMGREKLYEKKISLLSSLIETQTNHPSLPWRLQKETLFELAKSYEITGDLENAYDTFVFLVNHFRKEPSVVSEYAVLHAARLKFTLMRKEQKCEENKEIFQILSDLKEIQMQKSPLSEPLHLEAALEYAWIRAQMAKDQEKEERYLFFLNRIKEDFTDMEDPVSLQYQRTLTEHPEKMKLYTKYMQFVDAEIFKCKSVLATKEGKPAEAKESKEKAQSLFSSLASDSAALFYLKNRMRV